MARVSRRGTWRGINLVQVGEGAIGAQLGPIAIDLERLSSSGHWAVCIRLLNEPGMPAWCSMAVTHADPSTAIEQCLERFWNRLQALDTAVERGKLQLAMLGPPTHDNGKPPAHAMPPLKLEAEPVPRKKPQPKRVKS
jgi:hypothetical protein